MFLEILVTSLKIFQQLWIFLARQQNSWHSKNKTLMSVTQKMFQYYLEKVARYICMPDTHLKIPTVP